MFNLVIGSFILSKKNKGINSTTNLIFDINTLNNDNLIPRFIKQKYVYNIDNLIPHMKIPFAIYKSRNNIPGFEIKEESFKIANEIFNEYLENKHTSTGICQDTCFHVPRTLTQSPGSRIMCEFTCQ